VDSTLYDEILTTLQEIINLSPDATTFETNKTQIQALYAYLLAAFKNRAATDLTDSGDIDSLILALQNHLSDFTNPHQVTATQLNLGNVDNTADLDKPISTATQAALDAKSYDMTAHIADTDNPHEVTATQVGFVIDETNNTLSYVDSTTSWTFNIADLDTESGNTENIATLQDQMSSLLTSLGSLNLASLIVVVSDITTVTTPYSSAIYAETWTSGANSGYIIYGVVAGSLVKLFDPTTWALSTDLTTLQTTVQNILDNPVSTLSLTPASVGLGNVDNTADMDKPVSTATSLAIAVVQSALTNHIANTSNPHNVTAAQVGLDQVDNTSDVDKPISNAQGLVNNSLNIAIVANSTAISNHQNDYTNPHQVTATQVGLGNVDNTRDIDKPISNAVQQALDNITNARDLDDTALEGHINNFNNPHNVTATQLGLGNVSNLAPADMPVSTAVQTVITNLQNAIATNTTNIGNNTNLASSNQNDIQNIRLLINNLTAQVEAGSTGILGPFAATSDVTTPQAGVLYLIGTANSMSFYMWTSANGWELIQDLQIDVANFVTNTLFNSTVTTLQNSISQNNTNIQTNTTNLANEVNRTTAHLDNTNNPHAVNASQVGLGNVANLAPADLPLSTAAQNANTLLQTGITTNQTNLANHIANTSNPHNVTLGQLGGAPANNPAFTGVPTAPTASSTTNSTQIATTAYVQNITTPLTTTVAGLAPLNSPALIGTPTAPTAASTTNNTQVATTAFVNSLTSPINTSLSTTNTNLSSHIANTSNPHAVTAAQIGLGNVANVNQQNASNLTSGTVALARLPQSATANRVLVTGTANTAPNWGQVGLDTTQVTGILGIGNGGTNSITAAGALANLGGAPLASPALTGTPTAPTAAAGTNTTQIATTAFVQANSGGAAVPDSIPAGINNYRYNAQTISGTAQTVDLNTFLQPGEYSFGNLNQNSTNFPWTVPNNTIGFGMTLRVSMPWGAMPANRRLVQEATYHRSGCPIYRRFRTGDGTFSAWVIIGFANANTALTGWAASAVTNINSISLQIVQTRPNGLVIRFSRITPSLSAVNAQWTFFVNPPAINDPPIFSNITVGNFHFSGDIYARSDGGFSAMRTASIAQRTVGGQTVAGFLITYQNAVSLTGTATGTTIYVTF